MLMTVMILLTVTPIQYCRDLAVLNSTITGTDCTKPVAFVNFTDYSDQDQSMSTQIYFNDDTWAQRIVTKLNRTLNQLPCPPPRIFIFCLFTYSDFSNKYYYSGFFCSQPINYVEKNIYGSVNRKNQSSYYNLFKAFKHLENRLQIEQLLNDCGQGEKSVFARDDMYTKFDFKMSCRVSNPNKDGFHQLSEVLNVPYVKKSINFCVSIAKGTPVVQTSNIADEKTKRIIYGQISGNVELKRCKPANGRCSSKLLLIVNNLQTFEEKRLSMLSVLTVGCDSQSMHDDETLWRWSGYEYNENNFSYSWIISRASASVYSAHLTSKLWQYPIKFAQDYYPQLCQRYELTNDNVNVRTNDDVNSTSPWHAHWSLKPVPGVFWNSANVTNRILDAVADSTMLNSYCSVTLTLEHNSDIRNHSLRVDNGKASETELSKYYQLYKRGPYIQCSLVSPTKTMDDEIKSNFVLVIQCSHLHMLDNNEKLVNEMFEYGVELLENLTNMWRSCQNVDYTVKFDTSNSKRVSIFLEPGTKKIVTCPTMSLNQQHICGYVIDQLKSDNSTNQHDGNDDIEYRISVKCFDSNRDEQQACDIEHWSSDEPIDKQYRYCDVNSLKEAFFQKYKKTTTTIPMTTHRPIPLHCSNMMLSAIISLLIATVIALLRRALFIYCLRLINFKTSIHRTISQTNFKWIKPLKKRFNRQKFTMPEELSDSSTFQFYQREATIRQLYYPAGDLNQFHIEANDDPTFTLDDYDNTQNCD